MRTATLSEGRHEVSGRNPYSTAGWLAMAQAVLYPVGVFVAVIQQFIGRRALDYDGPVVGPGDLLLFLFTVFGIYTIWRLKGLLNARHGYHGVDTLAHLLMAWMAVNQIVTSAIDGVAILTGASTDSPFYVISALVMLVVFMVSGGVLNILIGARLLGARDELGDALRVYAVLVLVIGILMATVFLTPLAALLVPVACVAQGLVFLRNPESVDFV